MIQLDFRSRTKNPTPSVWNVTPPKNLRLSNIGTAAKPHPRYVQESEIFESSGILPPQPCFWQLNQVRTQHRVKTELYDKQTRREYVKRSLTRCWTVFSPYFPFEDKGMNELFVYEQTRSLSTNTHSLHNAGRQNQNFVQRH